MIRSQRQLHRRIWLILAPLLVAIVVFAIATRQSYPRHAPPAGVTSGR